MQVRLLYCHAARMWYISSCCKHFGHTRPCIPDCFALAWCGQNADERKKKKSSFFSTFFVPILVRRFFPVYFYLTPEQKYLTPASRPGTARQTSWCTQQGRAVRVHADRYTVPAYFCCMRPCLKVCARSKLCRKCMAIAEYQVQYSVGGDIRQIIFCLLHAMFISCPLGTAGTHI